ncbi:MAG: M56 family metallopeptidase, partial [Lachnospiraceae bacterium]|nr:M56 family metallopeptidase [Lachnospiraceae bacterium]
VRLNFGRVLLAVPKNTVELPVALGANARVANASGSGISMDTLLLVLTGIYLVGVVTYLLVAFSRFFRWKRTVLRLSAQDERYNSILYFVAQDMGIESVELRFSEMISSPMMIGLRKPTILLPNRKYNYHELRLILKHELMHFRHQDLWIKLLLIFCRAAHWFNPFMVLVARSLEQECEYYCDMAVMEGESEPMRKVYCESIVNTLADQVQRRKQNVRPVLATSFYSPKSGLKHRFSMVLRGKTRKFVGVLILAGMLTVVSGFVLGGKNENENAGSAGKMNSSGFTVTSEEKVSNTEWSEQEVEETTWTEEPGIEETTWIDEKDIEETTYYEESAIYLESSEYESSRSESVMWTGEMETEKTTQVAETFLSEPYVVRPSDS